MIRILPLNIFETKNASLAIWLPVERQVALAACPAEEQVPEQ
jgi:hypothetical protein